MHAELEKTCLPRCALPVSPGGNFNPEGMGACGTAKSGIFSRGKMYPAGKEPVDAKFVGVTPRTPVCAPGLAPGFCGRGIAGCVPPVDCVPELCCATLCAAACAAWLGP